MLTLGARLRALFALSLVAVACGTPTAPAPVPQGPTISSIAPNSGPTSGGTAVTIRGSGFAAGTTITIGGRPATDVSVTGADTVTARTPDSSVAGAVDVVVTLNGRTAAMTAGFRYDPVGPNTAPVISAIAAQGRRARMPASFADYGETIQVTLVVTDAESPASELTYEWRACGGTFTGTGPQVDWTAPAIGSLPSTCTIDVTIIDGPHVQTRSVVVRVHNSIAEVGALALEFLKEFANSMIPAEQTVRNFSDSCGGKASELEEVQLNRLNYFINSHTYGDPTVTVNFGGVCPFRARSGDACFSMPVEWRSTKLSTKTEEIAKGISRISAIYENSRWSLCNSDLEASPGFNLGFMH